MSRMIVSRTAHSKATDWEISNENLSVLIPNARHEGAPSVNRPIVVAMWRNALRLFWWTLPIVKRTQGTLPSAKWMAVDWLGGAGAAIAG